jgi:apolipoprotein N-acyltransferase
MIFLKTKYKPLLAALVSAGLLALSHPQTPGYPRWMGLLAMVALAPMLYISHHNNWKRALGYWGVFGYLYGLFLVHWLYTIHWLALLLLPLLFALAAALFGAYYSVLNNSRGRILAGAACWAGLEFLHSIGPYSFCWGLLGYGPLYAGYLTGWAAMLGPYACSYLTFLFNGLLAEIPYSTRGSKEWRIMLASIPALLVIGVFSVNPPPSFAPRFRALLVQGGHLQEDKWNLSLSRIFDDYVKLTRDAVRAEKEPVQLIIWPEAALTGILGNTPDLRTALHQLVQECQAPLLFGVLDNDPSGSEDGLLRNCAWLFTPDGGEQRYDKMHLVPWGECVPLGDLIPPLKQLVINQGGGIMGKGTEDIIFELPGGIRFSCLICFESTLPHMASRRVGTGADFLVAITNDAWFYESAALPQHRQASVMRAVENGVPVLRVGNTGLSCAISRTGEITGTLPPQVPCAGVVEIKIPRLNTPGGPYSRHGDGFVALCLMVVVANPLRRHLHRMREEAE